MKDERTRASISGKLGEAFVERKFGVVENGRFEIKSTARRNNQVVLKVIQLIQSGPKQFVIVRYERKKKKLKRGPRKGRYIPDEKIEEAFKKKLEVFVVRGFDLLGLIAEERRNLMKTKVENDAEWAFYWTVRIRSFEDRLRVVFEDEEVIVYGNPLDPPEFLKDEEERAGADEVVEDEVPF